MSCGFYCLRIPSSTIATHRRLATDHLAKLQPFPQFQLSKMTHFLSICTKIPIITHKIPKFFVPLHKIWKRPLT